MHLYGFKKQKIVLKFTVLQVGIRALVWGIQMHIRAHLNSNGGFEKFFDNKTIFKRVKSLLRQTDQSHVYDQPAPER